MQISVQSIAAPISGIQKPFTISQITDSHLCECDSRDEKRLLDHARTRDDMFSNGHPGALKKALMDMIDAAQDTDALILTGDIIDFPSQANLDALEEALSRSRKPILYTFGNHDYSVYTFDPASDATRRKYIARMLRALPNDPTYAHLDVGGVRFVALDDTLYQFSPDHLPALRADLSAGMPVVLCLHIPLYAPTLYEPADNFWRSPILTGIPVSRVPGGESNQELYPTRSTLEAMSLLQSSPALSAVLAGHLHFTHDDKLFPGITQYTCANGAMGFMRKITFTPQI